MQRQFKTVRRGRNGASYGHDDEVRKSAQALGTGRYKTWSRAPPCISKKEHRMHASASIEHRSTSRWTDVELEDGRKNYDDNLRRVQESQKRQRQRDLDQREKRQRYEADRCNRMQNQAAQYSDAVRNMKRIPAASYSTTGKRPVPPLSTHTSAVNRIADKRPRIATTSDILVWKNLKLPSVHESLVDRAIFERKVFPIEVDVGLILSCIRDGITIRYSDGGFYTDGMSFDNSMNCSWWKRLVSGIEIDDSGDRATIKSDGGTGCTRVGIGTFNAVVTMPTEKLPSWISENSVVRLTRPGLSENIGFMYQNVMQTTGEIRNSMFASMNGIGPPVYSIATFSSFRPGRTLRFGVVATMCRARKDLNKALIEMESVEEGRAAACACIDLLFKVSRLGIAFFDIKPGNILQFFEDGDQRKPAFYRLIDFDPAFFLRTNDRDWRSLLLLNLGLLSAHVYNLDLGAVGRGWAQAVKPALEQLIYHKDDYDSKWIFNVRCVKLEFNTPNNTSEFEMQRLFACMGTSYFYGQRRIGALSFGLEWKNITKNSEELGLYWREEKNKSSWPASWSQPDEEPLIKQLVDMSLRHSTSPLTK